jgi:hypothetical protein
MVTMTFCGERMIRTGYATLALLGLVAVLTGCRTPVEPPHQRNVPYVLGSTADRWIDDGVTNHTVLRVCEEPGFLEWARAHRVQEGYRVVISPTFSPAKVVRVILSSKTNEPSVYAVATDGKGGYLDTMTRIAARSERALSEGEVESVRNAVNATLLWNDVQEKEHLVLDGCSFLYEGIKAGRYMRRRYANPIGKEINTLSELLWCFAPTTDAEREEAYMCAVRSCFMVGARHLRDAKHVDVLAKLLLEPSDTLLVSALKLAEAQAQRSGDKRFIGFFGMLKVDPKTGALVSPAGATVDIMRTDSGGEDRWTYEMFAGNNEDVRQYSGMPKDDFPVITQQEADAKNESTEPQNKSVQATK